MRRITVTQLPPHNNQRTPATIYIHGRPLTIQDRRLSVPVATTTRGKELQIGPWGEPWDLPDGGLLSAVEIRPYYNHFRVFERAGRLWTVNGKPAFVAWNPDKTRWYGFTAPHTAAARRPYLRDIAEIEDMLGHDATPEQVALILALGGRAALDWA